jgi:hypothetical protein
MISGASPKLENHVNLAKLMAAYTKRLSNDSPQSGPIDGSSNLSTANDDSQPGASRRGTTRPGQQQKVLTTIPFLKSAGKLRRSP